MKKVLVFVVLLSLVAFSAVCLLTVAYKESPTCSIRSLVLDDGKMPDGWTSEWAALPPALRALGAHQAYSVFMENDNSSAQHSVYQYRNRWRSGFHFWFEEQLFFPSEGWNWSDWREASEIPLHADQRKIRCGNANHSHLDNRCTAVLRYGLYVSEFSASIEEGCMTRDQFLETLLRIDELLSSCAE
jgi:hypothetical protein